MRVFSIIGGHYRWAGRYSPTCRSTGHKTPGIGRKYEHVEMPKKFKAIGKLPVIPLAAA
jgi:hypothetical protein